MSPDPAGSRLLESSALEDYTDDALSRLPVSLHPAMEGWLVRNNTLRRAGARPLSWRAASWLKFARWVGLLTAAAYLR